MSVRPSTVNVPALAAAGSEQRRGEGDEQRAPQHDRLRFAPGARQTILLRGGSPRATVYV